MKYLILLSSFLVFGAYCQTDTISIVSYNVLNFPEGRNDCGTNVVVPERADTLQKILSYLNPDIFVACEIQTSAGADSILTRSLNANGVSHYAMANFTMDGFLNNSLYYNTNKLTLKSHDIIPTSPREIDHYVLYCNDPNLGVYYDTTFIEVYMCHLKAGNSSTNASIRAAQTQSLMDYIALRPSSSNHFVCGDLNVYSSYEAGYQNLISGSAALVDPINSPGSWNNNSSYAAIHTQSTRTSLNYDCGSKGGLDDRFDQILVSSNVMSGADSLKYLNNSYAAVGNDGNHFNSNLLGTNTQYPDSIVRALYYMSDHLPVILKSVVTYPTSNGLALYPVVKKVTCPNGLDGEAKIVPNDGQPPYTYQWGANTGFQTTQTATGLSTGSYCVQVTDDLGEVDDYCMFVPEPDTFSFNIFRQPDDGSCSGQAAVLIQGGTPPYSYLWNDPSNQTGQTASGLCAGNYQITVTDDKGCILVLNTIIEGQANISEYAKYSSLLIFPNPAKNKIYVELDPSLQVEKLGLFNTLGKEIKTEFSTVSKGKYQADLSTLPKGYYLVRLQTEGGMVTKRFIKL